MRGSAGPLLTGTRQGEKGRHATRMFCWLPAGRALARKERRWALVSDVRCDDTGMHMGAASARLVCIRLQCLRYLTRLCIHRLTPRLHSESGLCDAASLTPRSRSVPAGTMSPNTVPSPRPGPCPPRPHTLACRANALFRPRQRPSAPGASAWRRPQPTTLTPSARRGCAHESGSSHAGYSARHCSDPRSARRG